MIATADPVAPVPARVPPPSAPITLSQATAVRLRARPERIVVVGGGGWIGMATLEALATALGAQFAARVRVFGSTGRRLVLRGGLEVFCEPLEVLRAVPAEPALIFHYAFLTRDRVGSMNLDDYVAANRTISDAVADAARRLPARGLVIPSSGAVYARDGDLEHNLARNPYGALKVADEVRFEQLAARLGVPFVAPRVFNLSGPYINKLDGYAIASITRAVLRGEPVVLRADHPVIRSYLAVADLIELSVALLLNASERVVRFDTVGDEEVEVGELAKRACAVLGRTGLEIRRPPLRPDGLPDRYVGNPAKIAALSSSLGLRVQSLDEQLRRTAADLALRPDFV